MKLSQEQAAAILEVHQKWERFKLLVEEKNTDLQQVFTPSQKQLTKEGIVLLRKYKVAATNLLPNGIPKEVIFLCKKNFLEQVLAQMMDLHQCSALKKMEQQAHQKLRKPALNKVLNQLVVQTPIAQLFVQTLKSKVRPMKSMEDLKVILCILIAKYSLTKFLIHHYEEEEYGTYYQEEPNYLQLIKEDFEQLATQLLVLVG